MKIKINGRKVSVSGPVSDDMADDFMRLICSWSTTSKDITWEQVKNFSSPARKAWVRARVWCSTMDPMEPRARLSPEIIRDILLNQCETVANQLFDTTKVMSQIQPVIFRMTLDETVKVLKKSRDNIPEIVGMINKMHLPILATMPLGNYILASVADKLSGKEIL